MEILFISHNFFPEGNAPASRTYEHCKRWVAMGHRVTVVTSVPNAPEGVVYEGYRNKIWPQRENVDGIEVVRIFTLLAANSGNFWRIVSYLSYMFSAVLACSLFCRRHQVIVATSPQFFAGWAGVITSWLRWTPLVLEIRDIWPDSIVTVGAMKKGGIIRILEVLEKWMYRSSNAIVVVTEGLKEDIQSKNSGPQAIKVITNGVDLNRFPLIAPNLELRSKWQLQGKTICAYVGTVGMAHGLEVVLEAAEILKKKGRKDVGFLIVGEGAERAELQKNSEIRALSPWVRFVGRIPKEKIPEILASVDLLLIHLKKNKLFESAIPSKIFEGMAMNKPLLVGVEGEIRDIIQRSGCGIGFEPENPVDLVENIEKLIDDPDFRNTMENSGRSFVSENFSRDLLASEMLKFVLQSVEKQN